MGCCGSDAMGFLQGFFVQEAAAMDFEKLILARYSCRAYKTDPVGEEALNKILEAARLAPTAANKQAFRVVVVRTKGREEALRRIYPREWFVQPPLVLAVCAIPAQNWIRRDGRNYSDVDAAIVMDHLVLAAADLGLGTCWIANFDASAAREVLGLPPDVDPVVFTPLGWPADAPKPKTRKPLADIVRYDRWEGNAR
jgi:nitroreductase